MKIIAKKNTGPHLSRSPGGGTSRMSVAVLEDQLADIYERRTGREQADDRSHQGDDGAW